MDLMLKPRPKFEGMRLEGENVHRLAESKATVTNCCENFACNAVSALVRGCNVAIVLQV